MPLQAEHILLLGATGASGLVFLTEVLALPANKAPELTLYVRSRSKLPTAISHNPRIRDVEGSLDDSSALASAMENATTVMSFLGAYLSFGHFVLRTKTTPIADSFPAIFSAMRAKSVGRIMALSTPAAFPVKGESLSWGWWFSGWIPVLFAPQGNAEMKGIAERVAGQADLEWTVFRVPHLNDGDAGLKVAAGLLGPEYQGTTELSRGSMVRWALNELEERRWVRGAPVLGNC